MKIHFLLRFSLSLMALLATPANAAYPEGYPRTDAAVILDEVPFLDHGRHTGTFRVAYNKRDDEYLVAWLTPNGIRAIRISSLDLKPLRGPDNQPLPPFDIARVAREDRIDNPIYDNGDVLTGITDFDIGYKSGLVRGYFLAAKVQSQSTEGLENPCEPGEFEDCQEPYGYTQVLGNFLEPNRQANISEWENLAAAGDVATSKGIRVLPVPDVSSSTNSALYLFWHNGLAYDIAPDDRGSGSVVGRILTGRTGGELVFEGAPVVLMTVRDMIAGDEDENPGDKTINAARSFGLDGFDVAYNEDDRFLLAAAIGERWLFADGGESCISVSSYLGAITINRGLAHQNGLNANSYTKVGAEGEPIRLCGDNRNAAAKFSYNWTKYDPKVIWRSSDVSGSDEWLVTFTEKHDILSDEDCSGCLDTFYQDVFALRLRTAAGGLINLNGDEVLLGGRTDFVPDRQPDVMNGPSNGIWLDSTQRYLVGWDYMRGYADTLSDSTGSIAVSNSPLPLSPPSLGGRPYFMRSMDTVGNPRNQLAVLIDSPYKLLLQPIEFRWQDLALTVARLDGTDSVPIHSNAAIRLEVTRAMLENDVEIVTGAFDSGAYELHVTLPDGVELIENGDVTGSPEEGYVIDGVTFDEEDEAPVYVLEVRNANPFSVEQVVNISFALEGATDRFDFNADDDTATLSLALAADPEGTNPDDGDNTNPGDDDDDGDGDGDTGPDNGGDDNGGNDDTGNNPPGNDDGDDDDDDDAGGSGGGGALGWLLLCLAGFTIRRRFLN